MNLKRSERIYFELEACRRIEGDDHVIVTKRDKFAEDAKDVERIRALRRQQSAPDFESAKKPRQSGPIDWRQPRDCYRQLAA